MAFVEPVILESRGVRLRPLCLADEKGIQAAASDGQLWKLRVTSVPEPHEALAYIETALQADNRLAFAVTNLTSGEVLGATSYHDILPAAKRLEIGHTWYAARCQRTHINSTCKLLLMTHAFETLGCHVVGWRTDNFNFASQQAIERLGAQKDGVIRGNAMRRDGTIRDTMMYSLRAVEWLEAKAQLLYRLDKPRTDT